MIGLSGLTSLTGGGAMDSSSNAEMGDTSFSGNQKHISRSTANSAVFDAVNRTTGKQSAPSENRLVLYAGLAVVAYLILRG